MKINCIAIDDEPLALEKMKDYVSKVPFLNLVATFDNGIDSMEYLKSHEVDLMFLDIQMDEFSGIQVIEALQNAPKVILTTAFDEYALKGYELNISDYLLKPISFDRFVKSVEKVYAEIEKESKVELVEIQNESISDHDFIFVKSDYKLQKVRFEDILYIEGMKDYLRIVTSVKRLMVLQNFRNMEDALPNAKFIRVHKSYIVAVDKIDSIGKKSLIVGEQQIPIGESYKKEFFEFLENKSLL